MENGARSCKFQLEGWHSLPDDARRPPRCCTAKCFSEHEQYALACNSVAGPPPVEVTDSACRGACVEPERAARTDTLSGCRKLVTVDCARRRRMRRGWASRPSQCPACVVAPDQAASSPCCDPERSRAAASDALMAAPHRRCRTLRMWCDAIVCEKRNTGPFLRCGGRVRGRVGALVRRVGVLALALVRLAVVAAAVDERAHHQHREAGRLRRAGGF